MESDQRMSLPAEPAMLVPSGSVMPCEVPVPWITTPVPRSSMMEAVVDAVDDVALGR